MNWSITTMPLDGPLFEGAIEVYGDAFAEPPYSDPDRGRDVRMRLRQLHSKRDGYRAFVAVTPHNEVIGMIYGYCGRKGQWWHDTVEAKLDPTKASEWLADAYELVEVAVDPSVQGEGVGAGLIRQLLNGRPEATCLLSTRTDSRAHHLYQRLGFCVLSEMVFSPGGAPFYVMGKRLTPS